MLLPELPDMLTPAEVAAIFRVDVKSVARWSKAGKLDCIRTLGGHRRYRKADILRVLEGQVTKP